MNVESRLAFLERMLRSIEGEDACERVPIEWANVNEAGNMIGPGDDATPGQLRTWRTLERMLASVPYVPE